MNKTVSDFTRSQILEGLMGLTENAHNTFRLMYGRNGGKTSVEDAKKMPLEDVVKEIPDDKLDWALTQVERTIDKNSTKA